MARGTNAKRSQRGATPDGQIFIRHVTRRHLAEIARLGRRWDYNRQVDDRVSELPELNYPILTNFVHEHRRMRRCKPHMRCVALLCPGGNYLIFDVPLSYFERLPGTWVHRSRLHAA